MTDNKTEKNLAVNKLILYKRHTVCVVLIFFPLFETKSL